MGHGTGPQNRSPLTFKARRKAWDAPWIRNEPFGGVKLYHVGRPTVTVWVPLVKVKEGAADPQDRTETPSATDPFVPTGRPVPLKSAPNLSSENDTDSFSESPSAAIDRPYALHHRPLGPTVDL